MTSPLFRDNLAALRKRDPELADRVLLAGGRERLVLSHSRSGHPIPMVETGGRSAALHSTYDPIREANRLFSRRQGSFFVFLGLGAAHHLRPFLNSRDTSGILVVLPGVDRLRALISLLDLRDIIRDERVEFTAPEQPAQVVQSILSRYLPLVHGDLSVVSLDGAVRMSPEFFRQVRTGVGQVVDASAVDLSTQARLGKRWYSNILSNLSSVGSRNLPTAESVVVAAAGPSLEKHRRMLEEARYLIATDTSYPAVRLLSRTPDMIVSIDCQQISYHHFLPGLPPKVLLALDLVASPTVARVSPNRFFFAGGHPLARYLAEQERRLPEIDTSAGNVTHAAVSVAQAMGAGRIDVVGADFGYPLGIPYARGTYFYPYFRSREQRVHPLTTQLLQFVLDGGPTHRDETGSYHTARMDDYRHRLEGSFQRYQMRLVEPGHYTFQTREPIRISTEVEGSAGGLRPYLEGVLRLPEVTDPIGDYWHALDSAQKRLWFTLLPVAAGYAANHGSRDRLEKAKHWCIERVRTQTTADERGG